MPRNAVDDAANKVRNLFMVAIALIIVLSAFGIDASWVPNVAGWLAKNLIIDAVAAMLAGAIWGAVRGTARAFGLGAAVGATVVQVLQLVISLTIG